MTRNQLLYQQHKETQRSNRANEAETYRSNTARELETHRSNVADETETHRANIAKETENTRHNRHTEAAGYVNAGANVIKAGSALAKLFI